MAPSNQHEQTSHSTETGQPAMWLMSAHAYSHARGLRRVENSVPDTILPPPPVKSRLSWLAALTTE
eukprot:365198-Chlamydomonas_euryale.AAC.7